VGGQRHASTTLPTGNRPGTHCIGGCVVPRVGLDRWGISFPPPGFDPRTVQPVASRCADYAIKLYVRYSGNVFSNVWRVDFFVKLRINKRRAKPVGDDDKRGLRTSMRLACCTPVPVLECNDADPNTIRNNSTQEVVNISDLVTKTQISFSPSLSYQC